MSGAMDFLRRGTPAGWLGLYGKDKLNFPNAPNVKLKTKDLEAQAADTTPQHFMTPAQRSDMFAENESLSEARAKGFDQQAAARAHGMTSTPVFQFLASQHEQGREAGVGGNNANIETQDLMRGEDRKRWKLNEILRLRQANAQQQWQNQSAAYGAGMARLNRPGINWGEVAGKVGGAALGTAIGGPAGGAIGAQAGSAIVSSPNYASQDTEFGNY